jgi:hypothetical protein
MPRLVLPNGHTERDRRLAVRIAVALDSDELVVCRQHAMPRPAPRRPRPAPPVKPSSTSLLGELAVGLAFLWDAVVALGDRRRARTAR